MTRRHGLFFVQYWSEKINGFLADILKGNVYHGNESYRVELPFDKNDNTMRNHRANDECTFVFQRCTS